MARYRTEACSPAPADAVFAYLADFANAAEWDPGIRRATRRDRGEVVVGSTFDLEVEVGPTTTEMVYEVVAIDAPREVVLRSETPLMVSVDTITVRPEGDGSVATYDADLRLRGPLRLLDPLLALGFQRVGDRAAAGLRKAVGRLPVGR